jgi:hypothetical protein
MKTKFKCACGTTTRVTDNDAVKVMEKPKTYMVRNYKPTGKKK